MKYLVDVVLDVYSCGFFIESGESPADLAARFGRDGLVIPSCDEGRAEWFPPSRIRHITVTPQETKATGTGERHD